MSDLAVWHAELGVLEAARSRVDQMLAHGVQVWAEWPQRFYCAAAQVLHACKEDDSARHELAHARDFIAEMAAELTGADLARYLSVPWNRAIIAAHERDAWPSFPAAQKQ